MNNMVSAKHYLDFETKEPEIDAMVGAIDMSGALDNIVCRMVTSRNRTPSKKTKKNQILTMAVRGESYPYQVMTKLHSQTLD
jgi:hypothetical protein